MNDRELVESVLPSVPVMFSGHNLKTQVELFENAGFQIIESGEAIRPIKFYDTSAFVWFAKIIEWEFVGFSVDKCFENLLQIEKEISQNGCISGNIHRFYIVTRK